MCENMKCAIDLTLELHYEVLPWDLVEQYSLKYPGQIVITGISLMDMKLPWEIVKKLLDEYEEIFIEHILDNSKELNFM